jgi:hypothetical protein
MTFQRKKSLRHTQFSSRLKAKLGDNVRPIVVTDAGFKTPWLRAVLGQGWHYLGRTRHPNFLYWIKVKSGNASQDFISERQRGLRQKTARSIAPPTY